MQYYWFNMIYIVLYAILSPLITLLQYILIGSGQSTLIWLSMFYILCSFIYALILFYILWYIHYIFSILSTWYTPLLYSLIRYYLSTLLATTWCNMIYPLWYYFSFLIAPNKSTLIFMVYSNQSSFTLVIGIYLILVICSGWSFTTLFLLYYHSNFLWYSLYLLRSSLIALIHSDFYG